MSEINVNQFEEVYAAYRVFVLDVDGTLLNGYTKIDGVVESVYRLLVDPEKKVFFYTNGGYCTNEKSFEKVFNWLKDNLTPEQWAEIEPQVNVSLMYNTA